MISVDSLEDNTAFANKEGADFPILADPTKEVATKYGVLGDYSRYGLGTVANRWTFYIGKDGKIQAIDKDVQTRLATSAEDMAAKLGELKTPMKK